MPTGYLVTLGDNSLDSNDAISGSPVSFTTDSVIGAGEWIWTGVWTGNGGTYSDITDSGVYCLATDGNVYFVPDTWTISSGTAVVETAPAYISGPGVVDGTSGDDTIDAGYSDSEGDAVDDGDGSGPGGNGDTIDGGAGGDDNDTLVIQGPAVITLDAPGGENGTVTWSNGDILTFSDIENIDYIPCFTPGTQIKTARGEVPAARLRIGDRVLTRDNGYQTIRWTGARSLTADEIRAQPSLRPVRIRRGALVPNMPERDMTVSPQHRVLIGNAAAQMWFGEEEVLVAATHLTCLDGVGENAAPDGVTYVHILFDQHEVVLSDGIWSESFQPGGLTLAALDRAQRSELLTLFPELEGREALHEVYPAARSTLKAHQPRVLLRS